MNIRLVLSFFLVGLACSCSVEKQNPYSNIMFDGESLFNDIERYASFGIHRTGTTGDSLTTVWLREELALAGFDVTLQPIQLKQYIIKEAFLATEHESFELFPHWWWPEELSEFEKETSLILYDSSIDNYRGGVVFLPYQTNPNIAYLGAKLVERLERLKKKNAGLVVASLRDSSEETYLFNVKMDTQLPLPVLVSRPADDDQLRKLCEKGMAVKIKVSGKYEERTTHNVTAKRHVGLADGSKEDSLIVISTPMTGWFSCVGERGPGIALFLAFARWVDQNNLKGNYRLIASTGHELSHIGADQYLENSPPPVNDTKLWIHLGASLMVNDFQFNQGEWRSSGKTNEGRKVFNSSEDLSYMYEKYFEGLGFFTIPGRTVGEVNNVKDFGYKRYLGFGGKHHFFHTPKDNLETVSISHLNQLGASFEEVFKESCMDFHLNK